MKPRFTGGKGTRLLPLFLLSLSFLFSPVTLHGEVQEEGSRNQPGFSQLSLRQTETFVGEDTTQDIRLSPLTPGISRHTRLLLKFDGKIPALLRDETGNYQVEEARYVFTTKTRGGGGAALFNREKSRVVVRSPEELWPGVHYLEDFTIEFWINLSYFPQKSVIFQKMGFLDGKKRGMEIYVENRRMHVTAHNLFEDRTGELHSLHLVSRNSIREEEWIHTAFSYRAATGKMILYVNGKEERVLKAGNRNEVWRARFHPLDRSPLVIAPSLGGMLDDFLITDYFIDYNDLDRLHDHKYAPLKIDFHHFQKEQARGEVLSPVYHVGDEGAVQRGFLSYKSDEPRGSAIEFWVRYSPTPFHTETDPRKLAWKEVTGGSMHLPPFSYYQWKAELRSDPGGEVSPVLKEVVLSFAPEHPPHPPVQLEVVDELSSSRSVCLQWKKSPEPSVEREGGYVVYYGLKPGEYLGKLIYRTKGEPIRHTNQVPLTSLENRDRTLKATEFQKRMARRVRLVVDNRLIEENIVASSRRSFMPFLEPGFTYYFAVAAYSPEQGESERSSEVLVVLKGRTKGGKESSPGVR